MRNARSRRGEIASREARFKGRGKVARRLTVKPRVRGISIVIAGSEVAVKLLAYLPLHTPESTSRRAAIVKRREKGGERRLTYATDRPELTLT